MSAWGNAWGAPAVSVDVLDVEGITVSVQRGSAAYGLRGSVFSRVVRVTTTVLAQVDQDALMAALLASPVTASGQLVGTPAVFDVRNLRTVPSTATDAALRFELHETS